MQVYINTVFLARGSHYLLFLAALKNNKIYVVNSNTKFFYDENFFPKEFILDIKEKFSVKVKAYNSEINWNHLNLIFVILLINFHRMKFFKKKKLILCFHELNFTFLYHLLNGQYILFEEGEGFQWYMGKREKKPLIRGVFDLKKYFGGRYANKVIRTSLNNFQRNHEFFAKHKDALNNGVDSLGKCKFDAMRELRLYPVVWLHQCPVNCKVINEKIYNLFKNKYYKKINIKLHPKTCNECRSILKKTKLDTIDSLLPIEVYQTKSIKMVSLFSTAADIKILKLNEFHGDNILIETDEIIERIKRVKKLC